MAFKYPQYLVETDWLAEHLNDNNIRILACTAFNQPDESGAVRAESWPPMKLNIPVPKFL